MLLTWLCLALVFVLPSTLGSTSLLRLGQQQLPIQKQSTTPVPLVDLQVFAPPAIPQGGTNCTVELLKHSFGNGSYNNPVVVQYAPPSAPSCGEVGKWATIAMNLSVYT